MRIRSAKRLAQRIDLYYFKHASPLRRWRTILSIAAPAVGLLWLGSMAAAGNRAAYSSGPVAGAHAFAESKCEICHAREATFRAHVSDKACLTCHDAPAHARSTEPAPSCATCHREHEGRGALARTADEFCARCHGPADVPRPVAVGGKPEHRYLVSSFPAGHPDFGVTRGEVNDSRRLKFNHQVHLKKDLRGPAGPETLACSRCHAAVTTATAMTRRRSLGDRMTPLNYEDQCARCHPLFFDERLDIQAPHKQVYDVFPVIERAFREYIAAHPSEISTPDPPPRRVPLNFALPPASPARNADEWVAARMKRADTVLGRVVCGSCHLPGAAKKLEPVRGREIQGPTFSAAVIGAPPAWMPHAAFDHHPHLMVDCTSCHDAAASTVTTDVIMPRKETCATCHAPDKGAESRCFECHAYHEWSKEKAVTPRFRVTDFR
jgi:predicted CXXCH cytochrome family protein